MAGFPEGLTNFRKKKFSAQDTTYEIEGISSASFQLDSGTTIHIEEILYVPGLKKNLLSIASLEDKGYRVVFMDRKSLVAKE